MRHPRRLLVCVLAALLTFSVGAAATFAGQSKTRRQSLRVTAARSSSHRLNTSKMNSAMQLQGTWGNGVLSYSFDRTDLNHETIHGVPVKPSFEIDGSMDFQPLGRGRAFINGDLPVPTDRMDQTISTILSNHLTFQAEHQHFYDLRPIVWFIHIRGRGNGVTLAREVHKVLVAASTPLPQSSPANPTTPFNVKRIKRILHAYSDQVGSDGVVTYFVSRRNPIHINGIRVKPATNIATNIAFEPLNASGSQAAVAPDFAMVAGEINRTIATMRAQGWDIGCLYNQETAEHPQLYFSHNFKTGNPYNLARQIRKGLNRTNSH